MDHQSRRTILPGPPSSSSSASTPPSSATRARTPFLEAIDGLGSLHPRELAAVQEFVERLKAARGAAVDPELRLKVLVELERLWPGYRSLGGVPIPALRIVFRDVPPPTLDRILKDAEERRLLELRPVELPAPFVAAGSGVQSLRGLLYYVVPGRGAS